MSDSRPTRFNMSVPAEQRAGTYGDFVSVWHTRESFVLDFAAVTGPNRAGTEDDGTEVNMVDCEVVSRVRLPASQIWEVMKALQTQLGRWEEENPHRRPPQPDA